MSLEIEQAAIAAVDPVTELFEAHYREIFAYLYRLLGDERHAAEDLTQETFLRLLQQEQKLAAITNQRAWLYRIATNTAFNWLKRRRRFAWLPWRWIEHNHWAPNPAEDVERSLALAQALDRLDPEYRAPLLLYSYAGFSVREVAKSLEISEGNVRVRIYRAREMLRKVIDNE